MAMALLASGELIVVLHMFKGLLCLLVREWTKLAAVVWFDEFLV